MPVSDESYQLRDGSTDLTSTENCTGANVGASPYQGIKAIVYVPEADDAADTLDIHFEDSPDDVTYTDIEGGAMTQITGTTSAAVYEFVLPPWTGPYLRAVCTVAGTTPDFGAVEIGLTPGRIATT